MLPTLIEIERSIRTLSVDEQLWLLELIAQRLRQETQTDGAATTSHRQQLREALVNAGLSSSSPTVSSTPSLISTERREELAHLFSVGRPLSELIIEEREGR